MKRFDLPKPTYHKDDGGDWYLMPFGKHEGKEIGDVPGDYLTWLSANADLEDDAQFAVECELDRRRRIQLARYDELWKLVFKEKRR